MQGTWNNETRLQKEESIYKRAFRFNFLPAAAFDSVIYWTQSSERMSKERFSSFMQEKFRIPTAFDCCFLW